MHIRPATPSDISSTASISTLCFWNDELYVYTNPWRERYPDHFRALFLRRHKLRLVTPGYVFLVAVTDEGDRGHEGEGLERTLLTAQESYLSLLRADRSLHPARLAHFLAEAKSDFASIPEIWKLQNLAVHPDFQRRGVASSLLDWGKRQAEREGCPIGLESSELARPLYLRNGFRKFGSMLIRDFPIKDVPIFLWEPRGREGRWGMKGDVGV
ncbi:MAG: hypothetical protein ASARMPREDX12_005488 [Alectoria sarmentosa]|nr:MAG: hypothetical protein ASARMPREDX12_005488 [Alectoria sarmentosa]